MASHEQRSDKGIDSVRDAERLTKCDALLLAAYPGR